MRAYVKRVGKVAVKVLHNGNSVIKCILYYSSREKFSLGYVMSSKSWYGSTCFNDYEEGKEMLPFLQEMLDIFDDGDFTGNELKLLGYKDEGYGN